MSQGKGETVLTVVWSLGLYAGGAVVGVTGLLGSGFDGPDWLAYRLLTALGASCILLAVGAAMSLSSPLPEDPRGGSVPFRLLVGWSVMGLCPPPSRVLSLVMSTTASALCLIPTHSVEAQNVIGAAALVCAGAFHGRPKTDLSLGRTDILLIVGLGLVGARALSLASSTSPEEPWRFVGAFAALTVLAAQRTRELCAAMWTQLRPNVPPPPALDLSRYEVTVDRKGPEKRADLPDGVEAQLVDSGSFKVDAARMLDKLRGYQLNDPDDFICAWLRCAVASGAGYISLKAGLTSIELAFNGRAFSAAELSQPYQALVDAEGINGKRGRHFAYGLLGLYRLSPKTVSVTSRGPGGVATMSAGGGKAPDPEKAPEGTVILVDWPAWALVWRPHLLAHRARQRFGLARATLSVNRSKVRGLPSGDDWTIIDDNGWRGMRRLPGFKNRVRLYVLGTLIEELEGDEVPSVEAWLTHDDLELDISQSSVVRGRLFDAGINRL